VNNNHDFSDLLGEMLGELNASHTGGRYRPTRKNGSSTASFGILYDVHHRGLGLKVKEILKKGVADKQDTKIKPGVVITHINGVQLTPKVNPWKLLDRKQGRPVRLGLSDFSNQKDWEEVLTPANFSSEKELLYQRWIKTRRELCHRLSGGKVGYVHVKGMNDASFREVYSDVLGVNNEKLALVVDTRFNGGGWLHDDLITLLDGERYCFFLPRDHAVGDLGGEPAKKWTRPVCVLQSESNYSDAHFFPWAFKAQGVGKLIGAPVPGTTTAVWWERQIDPSLIFGIPQVGVKTVEGKYLENLQLEPDILVVNDPGSSANGKDKQLEAAVKEMLREIKGKN
jgi:tricorn protease